MVLSGGFEKFEEVGFAGVAKSGWFERGTKNLTADIAFSPIQNNGKYYFSFAGNDYITKSASLTTAIIIPGAAAADKTVPLVKAISLAPEAVTVVNSPFRYRITLRFDAAMRVRQPFV